MHAMCGNCHRGTETGPALYQGTVTAHSVACKPCHPQPLQASVDFAMPTATSLSEQASGPQRASLTSRPTLWTPTRLIGIEANVVDPNALLSIPSDTAPTQTRMSPRPSTGRATNPA